jgi:ribosomal protein L11 methyltransferase
MPQNANSASTVQSAPKVYFTRFEIPYAASDYFAENLADSCLSLRFHEKFEDSPIWYFDMYFHEAPQLDAIRHQVAKLAQGVNIPAPEVELHEQENKNWVEELSKNFCPIEAGRFYIYSEFSEPSGKLIDIRINPGMAFGTGQHETTFLCLSAINWLYDEGYKFSDVLDLGAGSGILAIAAAKLWEAKILASDNDPIATVVCAENAEVNSADMQSITSEGLQKIDGSYDLILANILMNPLLAMAEDILAHSNGVIVLSGFKIDQQKDILDKYTGLGFKHLKTFQKNDWLSEVLTK